MVKLKELSRGSKINFGGAVWTLINPTTGHMYKNIKSGTGVYDGNGSGTLSPSEGIFHYLNTTYFNTLTVNEKGALKTASWSNGMSSISSKVGILMTSEWRNNADILPRPSASAWLNEASGSWGNVITSVVSATGVISSVPVTSSRDIHPVVYLNPETSIVDGNVSFNASPTIVLNTTDNRTLYESDVFTIDGTTTDADSGNVVNVKYQINGGTIRAIATSISTGAAIPFNKVLTFKGSMLYDGATAVTSNLAEGSQHVLKVWSEDDQGGKSAESIRAFYVVPNRPATLTIDAFSQRTDLIDSDAITISGNVSDPDNNNVVVKYKIANGSFTEVYSGSGGSFSFQVSLSALNIGANTITIQATDSYGAVTSKTLSVNKAENSQPLLTSVVRYKLTPPNGTAKGVVLWIQREVGDLVVDAEISMGANGAAENFVPMVKESMAFVTEGIEEDEFTFENASAVENIVLKLTMTRSSVASDKGIKLVSGVLS